MHGSIMFACAIALVPCCSAPARAGEQRQVTCENTEAVYAGIDNANYRIIFQGRTLGHGPPRLVGLLRMTKGEKTVEFRFTEE